jgi:lipopolysaccharide transport system ATP-binding protein
MSDTAIRVTNLSKRYRIGLHKVRYRTLRESITEKFSRISRREQIEKEYFWALKDIDFEVKKGESLGIIGRNGAGKSTLLKVLSRITKPTKGRAVLDGRVGSLLEVGTGFHPELTGRENIYLNGAILGMMRSEIERKFDEIVDFSGIEKFLETPVKRYSSGMYVRLAFAVAAHLEPEILMVDEVLAVGDAEFQKKCLGKMGEVTSQGRTVLFVSHNLLAVENLCRKALLLDNGKMVEIGDANTVIETYLSSSSSLLADVDLLANIKDRKGDGTIRLTSFSVEGPDGKRPERIRSGSDVKFVFGFTKNGNKEIRNIDIGFSVHSEMNELLFVFYSSYVNQEFPNLPPSGYFRCLINDLPLPAGRYQIGARVLVNGVTVDWPKGEIGSIIVEAGDFYKTGSKGYDARTAFLIKGQWEVS